MKFHLSRRRGPVASRLLWRVLLVAAFPLGAACRDVPPTQPRIDGPSQAQIAAFLPSVEDAIQRLAPAITDPKVSSSVRGNL